MFILFSVDGRLIMKVKEDFLTMKAKSLMKSTSGVQTPLHYKKYMQLTIKMLEDFEMVMNV